jgi:hypothetical protein
MFDDFWCFRMNSELYYVFISSPFSPAFARYENTTVYYYVYLFITLLVYLLFIVCVFIFFIYCYLFLFFYCYLCFIYLFIIFSLFDLFISHSFIISSKMDIFWSNRGNLYRGRFKYSLLKRGLTFCYVISEQIILCL